MSSVSTTCQNCKKDFTIEPEDFSFYEKIKVPPPTFCPECRMVRRINWRNERVLHKAVCNLCDKKVLSMFNQEDRLKVYCDKCWWGDGWDPMEYGEEYDFSKFFFKQWISLFKKIPLIQAWKFSNVNCDYIHNGANNKNCYLCSSVVSCENVLYSYAIDNSQNVLDSTYVDKEVWCYGNIDSQNNYNSIFLENSSSCIDSGFLFDCVNCQNCFLSSNLRNKKYFFENKQYTKEEYEKKLLNLNTKSFLTQEKVFKKFIEEIKVKAICKYANNINVNNCTGNNIRNSKNIFSSFNVYDSENVKYTARTARVKDSMDIFGNISTELAYDSIAPSFKGSNTQFSMSNQSTDGIRYSMFCSNSSHLFGCIALKGKSYCILNKQYTKEQYEELVPKIIKHMNDLPYIDQKGRIYKYGEFFPPELSPFCYNETIAQEYFPLTKEEALKQGYRWKEKEERNYTIDIYNKDIPDDINEVTESIINKVIECSHKGECNEQCTEAYKIIPEELSFYKRMNLPLPRLCPNCRHYQRLKQRNPLKLWHRHCMKEGCPNEFETSYSPDRPEIIYCEKCYNQEVY